MPGCLKLLCEEVPSAQRAHGNITYLPIDRYITIVEGSGIK
jgi:hypothetical protein